ncbi:MAG: hypothetical protein M3010_08100, partial [Candidatus Dormibacteraeota bacterium]|nr:hypothetical protein [Candidatus Dormibacteraeota bacterium]
MSPVAIAGLMLLVSALGPLAVVASAESPHAATFRVGTAAVSITPQKWPVHAAAYGIHTASHEQQGRPFMARSIAISAADGSSA